MLEMLAVSGGVQPQLQPQVNHAGLLIDSDGFSGYGPIR